MIPLWSIKLGAGLLLVGGVWLHGYTHGQGREQRKTAAAVQAATDAARAEENRRVMRLQEAQDAEYLARQAAQRDAAAARAAVVSLRQQAADFAAVPSDPGAPASCPPDPRPMVLAELFGSAIERADKLAREADAAIIAGQLCERTHDALK